MTAATLRERFNVVEKEWKECTACPLHCSRTNVVNYRGYAPTDFVFVGEGPGAIEDLQGKPFVGPAGRLLETMIADAFERVVPIGWDIHSEKLRAVWMNRAKIDGAYEELVRLRTLKWPKTAFMNLVACIPLTNGRIAAPSREAVDACRPRMLELLSASNPKAVVRCGSQARVNLPDKLLSGLARLERISNVVHPAALLRQASMDKDYKATVNEFAMLARELGFGK